MSIVKSFSRWLAHRKTSYFIDYVRIGWNSYSFIFYIGGISAILGSLFGSVGWLSVIITVSFFYLMGRVTKEIDEERSKTDWRERKR